MLGELQTQFAKTGRMWIPKALDEDVLNAFERITAMGDHPGKRLSIDAELQGLLSSTGPVGRVVQNFLPDSFPVRCIAFNKTEQSNWAVPWHQDRIIAVADRHDVSGYSNWSCKIGVWHCEPPSNLLESMVFARIHLDDCHAANGAMEIVPGSHLQGVIPAGKTDAWAENHPTEMCSARRGDVLLLHMLLLHRSRPTSRNSQRRVLRVDYANTTLSAPLSWAG